MRFNFTRISNFDIKNRLKYICVSEGYINFDDCIDYISKICKGQMRDAVQYLEKVASYDYNLSIENTIEALGDFSYDTYIKLTNALIDCNEAETLMIINNVYNSGNDLKKFIDNYLVFLLDVSKYILFKSFDIINIPSNYKQQLDGLINFDNSNKYYRYIINNIFDLKNTLKTDYDIKSSVEVILIKISNCM